MIYVVCGVPGAGKTWVCSQLGDKFKYVPQDEYIKQRAKYLDLLCSPSYKPMLTDCPFGETRLRDDLETRGIEVTFLFIVEHPLTVSIRYWNRESRKLDPSSYARASTIGTKADQWRSFKGTSAEVLEHLRKI